MEYAFIWCVNDDDLPELPPLSELGELIAD